MVAVGSEAVAIELVESGAGSNPDVAILVLADSPDVGVGEFVGCEKPALLCHGGGGDEQCENDACKCCLKFHKLSVE